MLVKSIGIIEFIYFVDWTCTETLFRDGRAFGGIFPLPVVTGISRAMRWRRRMRQGNVAFGAGPRNLRNFLPWPNLPYQRPDLPIYPGVLLQVIDEGFFYPRTPVAIVALGDSGEALLIRAILENLGAAVLLNLPGTPGDAIKCLQR
ncbi:hypothetical protein [Pararhizobium sp. PWRC1-1]|uniref:hypothetical protein n=1 Tax=Pararhizobium sp. PWRC1-1 TaxID=2804566 RepID=UPI003CE6A4E1